MNPEQFSNGLKEKGIILSDFQKEQFRIYFNTLIEWNEKVNLTAITDEEEVYLKHFYDSITPSFFYDFKKSIHICDVGAGAGFPSIPLKICFPNLRITIVDSLNKRITFLQHLTDVLKIDNVSLFHSRAEEFGQRNEHREKYDLVMARAVARMSVLSELCLPLVRKEGTFIALKGGKIEEEIQEAKKAIKILGGEVQSIDTFYLPKENSDRSIVRIAKIKHSPKRYPRKPGTPNRNPIK